MKILFAIHTPKSPQSAIFNHYHQLSEYLKQFGYEADIVAPQDFPALNRKHARWFVVLYPFYLARWLMEAANQYDLVSFHSYSGWVVNLLRRLLPGFRHFRTITDFHGLEPLSYNELKAERKRIDKPLNFRYQLIHGYLMRFILGLTCRRSDWVMCLNQDEVDFLKKNSWADESKIILGCNSVAAEFFIQREYRVRARRLLFTGQWIERKGVRYLVEAFIDLINQRPELELWCVGTLLDEEEVLDGFPDNIKSSVVVRPRVTREEIIQIGSQADVFVFPTISEAFGVALLEAMAMGLPIVSTAEGVAKEALQDNKSALFVPKRDSKALAQTIRQLLDDKSLREKLGSNAAAKALRYEASNVLRERLALYHRMVFSGQLNQEHNQVIENCSTRQ